MGRHGSHHETETIDGFEVYKDDKTGLYVAAHPEQPVSSTGETTQEAVSNAHEALSLYEPPQTSRDEADVVDVEWM